MVHSFYMASFPYSVSIIKAETTIIQIQSRMSINRRIKVKRRNADTSKHFYDHWKLKRKKKLKIYLFLGTLFYYFYLPETKGKTLQEIEDYFSGRTTTLKTKKQASNFNININAVASEQTLTVEKEKLLLA